MHVTSQIQELTIIINYKNTLPDHYTPRVLNTTNNLLQLGSSSICMTYTALCINLYDVDQRDSE